MYNSGGIDVNRVRLCDKSANSAYDYYITIITWLLSSNTYFMKV